MSGPASLGDSPAFLFSETERLLCGELGGGGEDFGEDGVDVGFGGAVVDDAGTEGEVTADRGVGEVDAAATDYAIEDAAVEFVEISG